MPRLVRNGEVLAEHPTRAECLVRAFELKLVYDYGRRRNSLLPGVKVEGSDEIDSSIEPTPGRLFRHLREG